MGGIYGTETITLPLAWLTALATSDLRLFFYAERGLYGVMRFLHLVGMASFVGMVVVIDLRGLGLVAPSALEPVRGRLITVLNTSFWLTVVTGSALFLRDPVGMGLHSMFLPKLLLVVAGYAYGNLLRRMPLMRRPDMRRVSAAVSLGIWLLVIGASTWNHVERPVRVGDALRLGNTGK